MNTGSGREDFLFFVTFIVIIEMVVMVLFVMQLVLPGMSKYVNDIQGNTIQEDKSTRFHVLELHGMTAGVTSSLFVGALMILCAAYFCYKVGITKVLQCCCSCLHQGGAQGVTERHQLQNFPVMAAQPMQQPMQQQQAVVPTMGVEQFGTLDLPKGLTLKMIQ